MYCIDKVKRMPEGERQACQIFCLPERSTALAKIRFLIIISIVMNGMFDRGCL
jgi:hypothetical protein